MKFISEVFNPPEVKKEPVRGDLRDIKRRDFKPTEIKVLFACESLPYDTENFFYYAHSPLYNNTLGAFKKVFPKITQANFFQYFKDLGFYLDDLCGQPVNQLKKGNDRKKRIELRKLYEPDFAKRVELYKPQFIIITPMEIKDNISNVISSTNIDIPFTELSFPVGSQTNANNYINGLVDLLYELLVKKIIFSKDPTQWKFYEYLSPGGDKYEFIITSKDKMYLNHLNSEGRLVFLYDLKGDSDEKLVRKGFRMIDEIDTNIASIEEIVQLAVERLKAKRKIIEKLKS